MTTRLALPLTGLPEINKKTRKSGRLVVYIIVRSVPAAGDEKGAGSADSVHIHGRWIMRFQRLALCLLACLIAVGCASTEPKPAKAIPVKHHKEYVRARRFWAGEIGDVQGFVLPLVLVSPARNRVLQEATKGQYIFFVVAMHNKASNEALTIDKATPEIRVFVSGAAASSVSGLTVIDPLVRTRLDELSAERNRLSREIVTSGSEPAPAAAPAPAREGAAPAPEGAAPAPKPTSAKEELAGVEDDIAMLESVRAYLQTGNLDTKRGVLWHQIVAIPGKEDIAAIQSVEWGYTGNPPANLQEYGYRYDTIDKLKLKRIAERPTPSLKRMLGLDREQK